MTAVETAVTRWVTEKVLWKAASTARGLRREELAEQLEALAMPLEEGEEMIATFTAATAEFVAVVEQATAGCSRGCF